MSGFNLPLPSIDTGPRPLKPVITPLVWLKAPTV
jgi:hypothetical protein